MFTVEKKILVTVKSKDDKHTKLSHLLALSFHHWFQIRLLQLNFARNCKALWCWVCNNVAYIFPRLLRQWTKNVLVLLPCFCWIWKVLVSLHIVTIYVHTLLIFASLDTTIILLQDHYNMLRVFFLRSASLWFATFHVTSQLCILKEQLTCFAKPTFFIMLFACYKRRRD